MSGELLQNNKVLTGESFGIDNIDMKAVTQVLCPTNMCEKKEGIAYGRVLHFEYDSKFTGLTRGANILLPDSYDEKKEYPVLYFLHGIFGDEYSMINDENSRVQEIIGNLQATNLMKEAIVVFPNMFATSDPNLEPGFTIEQIIPYDLFINDLTGDLIPYIESHYSVKKDRENRGIIGFSMGGRESMFIGMSRSDLFGYIGAIAPAPGLTPNEDMKMLHPGQLSEDELVIKMQDYEPHMLMVCCGTNDSVVGQFPLSYHEIMSRNGVSHIWYEVPEADHDFNAIRSGLYNFCIRWFL